MDLYDDRDRETVSGQLRVRLILFLVFVAVWLGGSIAFIAMRMQTYAILCSAVLGCIAVFLFYMKVMPVIAYRRFLRDMDQGLRRTSTLTFVSCEDSLSVHDGVEFRVLRMEEGGDERTVYVDASKSPPAFTPGQRLEIDTFGNNLCAYRLLDGGAA